MRLVWIPFAPRFEWRLDGRGNVWLGWGGEYRIVRRGLRGDTTLVIRRVGVEPVRVSAEERTAVLARLGSMEPNQLSRIPDVKPIFTKLVPADDGTLWVLRPGEGMTWFWDVFSAEGRFLGSVDMPAEPVDRRNPVVTRDAVIVITQDQLDVQYVVKFRRVR